MASNPIQSFEKQEFILVHKKGLIGEAWLYKGQAFSLD